MKIYHDFEKYFKPYISQCRPGDWTHAKRVVDWVKYLASEREDVSLLVIAAYVHDIGWYKLCPQNKVLTKAELILLQPKANLQTRELLKKILEPLTFTSDEVEKIYRLVQATESYEATQEDEMILVDADNLSKTAPEHVMEKYDKKDWLSMCTLFEEKFPKRIQTDMGKRVYAQKLKSLRNALAKAIEE